MFNQLRIQLIVLLTLLGSTTAGHSQWPSGVIMSGGNDFGSDTSLTSYRISIFKTWNSRWFNEGDWYIGGYYDLSLNHWKNKLSDGPDTSRKGRNHITAVAFSPVFRITRKSPWFGTWTPFAEAGIGLSYLSASTLQAKNDDQVDLGIRLQFEDRIGFGFQFGERQQYQLMLRAFHYSNAGLHRDNDGFNLNEIAFGWSF